jgi:hypothetical protein
VHLRRALLLFAIVLGLAAVAASISRPDDDSPPESPPPSAAPERPTVQPGTAVSSDAVELVLDADRGGRVRLTAGQAATLLVEASEPGQVEIPDLGLVGFAEPLTAARFELLRSEPGRHEVVFTPTDGDEPRPAGTLVVRSEDA